MTTKDWCSICITVDAAPIHLSISPSTLCLLVNKTSSLTWSEHSILFRLRTVVSGLEVPILIPAASHSSKLLQCKLKVTTKLPKYAQASQRLRCSYTPSKDIVPIYSYGRTNTQIAPLNWKTEKLWLRESPSFLVNNTMAAQNQTVSKNTNIIHCQQSHLKGEYFYYISLSRDSVHLTWGMLIPFLICSCSQRLTSSSCPVSSASSSLPSIPVHIWKTHPFLIKLKKNPKSDSE